jgi:large subunit ribosomal protein L10
VKIKEKQELVQSVAEKFSKAKVVIATDYKGLDVEKMNQLRRQLRENAVEFQVVKNTLLRRAAENSPIDLMNAAFVGPSAIACSYDDPVSPAKVLIDFAKENKALEIKAAVLDGKLLDFDGIKALADLPSREVLLSQLLSVMNGVPTAFVRVLNAVPQHMLNVLVAVKDQKEAAGE